MIKFKRFFGILLSVSLLASLCITAEAEGIYNGDFLRRKYTLFAAQSVDSENIGEFTQISDDLFPGKTEFSFDFSAQSLSDSEVSFLAQRFNSEDSLCALSLVIKKTAGGFSVSCVNAHNESVLISDGLKTDKTYCAVVQLDLTKSLYNIVLYEGSEKNCLIKYKRGVSIGAERGIFGFRGVGFDLNGISVSNFFVYRERLADNKPVTDIKNGIVSVGANITGISKGEAFDVYVAFYSDDRSRLLNIEKKECIYNGFDSYSEVFFPLSENFKSTCPISVFVLKSKDVYPLSQNSIENISNSEISYENYIAYTGFSENENYEDRSNLKAAKLPSGWYAQAWSGPSAPYDILIETDDETGGYLSLGAAEKGYMGVRSSLNALPENGVSVSFNVKCSEDYAGNAARIVFLYFDESGSFISSDFSVFRNISPASWQNETLYISPDDYPEGASRLSVAFCTNYISAEYGGRLYYDSLCIDNLNFNMQCSEKLSWYSTGEEVCYKPKFSLCDKISKICGCVYDSDGVLIDEVSVSAADAEEIGWKYTPKQSGFYKVVFYAQTNDNRILFEHNSYKAYYEKNTKTVHYIERPSHDFYITDFKNKDFGERSKLYGMSIGNYDGEYDLGIADKIGMSFVRLHSFSWKDIEPEDVTADNGKQYNWTNYDKIFNAIRNNGYNFDVIGNILFTPKWASPSSDESGELVPMYASYAPTDSAYLTDFIKDLYARYGDAVNIWEIYNEPHLPGGAGSVFWHDSPANYVGMLSSAYSTLKSLSGGEDTVTMGGIGAKRYLSFYREFIQKGGWQYTDKLVMHGYDLDPWNYLDVNSKLGYDTGKGVINTESHMILFNGNSSNIYYTEKQLALRMYIEYFRQIKYGVEQIAFFQPYDNSVQAEDLMILDNMSGERNVVTAGIFRKKPNYEPRFSAGALNTLIAMSGKSISYCDEYKSENVNIAEFESDGEPLYVIWGDNLEAMSDSADIGNFDETVQITDWEGRKVSPADFKVCANEVYFIKGLGGQAFSHLGSSKGDSVYSGGVLYSENEMNKREVNGSKAVSSSTPLFEHNAENVYDGSAGVKWNDITLYSGKSHDGKLAVNACTDGLDCVIKLKTNASVDLSRARLAVGVDTFANGIITDVVEITADMQDSGCTVTKTVTPDICGDLPSDDYSGKGETVNGAEAFVKNEGDYSYYCIHIPFTQLYPYFYDEGGSINFGMMFTGYDSSDSVLTSYCWGKGYSPYKPWEFGTAVFETEKIFSGAVYAEVQAEAGEYVTAEILKDGQLVYFNQYKADSDGKCSISAQLDADGEYELITYSNLSGYGTMNFTYTVN